MLHIKLFLYLLKKHHLLLHVATTVIQLVKNNKYWSCKRKDVNVYLHIKWESEIKTHEEDTYGEALCDQV